MFGMETESEKSRQNQCWGQQMTEEANKVAANYAKGGLASEAKNRTKSPKMPGSGR